MPNVGKSTLFNTLTGASAHTGNWSGKTVEVSVGDFSFEGREYTVTDLPGTYSLCPESEEEEIAFSSLLLSDSDVLVVVCDESRLLSNMSFIISALEMSERAVVALNFCESAEKTGRQADVKRLSDLLAAPVVRVNARKKSSLASLLRAVDEAAKMPPRAHLLKYGEEIEKSVSTIGKSLGKLDTPPNVLRMTAIRALSGDSSSFRELCGHFSVPREEERALGTVIEKELVRLGELGIDSEDVSEEVSEAVFLFAKRVSENAVKKQARPRVLGLADRILTGRVLAFPAMLVFLGIVLFITVKLAAYPSQALEYLLDRLNAYIRMGILAIGTPPAPVSLICDGALGTLFTVTAVMLPPMAIFFPFFAILEDSGYLPRIAYNLDRPLSACGSCGKGALTACMGLGCNAVGVTGARIIETKRERLVAVLTNAFIPCNGRFPMLTVICASFLSFYTEGALAMLLLIVLSFAVSLGVGRVIAFAFKKEKAGLFTLELPPYRRPAFMQIIKRSFRDKTLKIFLRAAAVSLPAGVVIWLLSNTYILGVHPTDAIVSALDPIGRFMGLDGVMLTAFVLGLPANETVLPIALSLYGGTGTAAEILSANAWGVKTAVCASIFTLFHWPCATTIMTVKRETGSAFLTLLAVLIPTAVGILLASCVNFIF